MSISFFSRLKQQTHHILFALTLFALAALLAWWSVFIRNAIHSQRADRFELLVWEMKLLVKAMESERKLPDMPGMFLEDNRFEIVRIPLSSDHSKLLIPIPGTEFYLQPRLQVIEHVEKRFSSLKLMLAGESVLLFAILLVCILFLYRYVQIEKRSHREIKKFWERTSHEIKTPITGIKIFLQNLKNRPEEFQDLTPYLDMALVQVNRQERLAENILFGHRVDGYRSSLEMREIELTSFLQNYCRNSFSLTDENCRLEIFRSVQVKADPSGLKLILDNLVDNAVKYIPENLFLCIGIREYKKRIEIIFRDNGPGFDPGDSHAVFSAFKRLNAVNLPGPPGSGLGLSISRKTARIMGGDLTASSPGKGKGAVFFLSLKKIT